MHVDVLGQLADVGGVRGVSTHRPVSWRDREILALARQQVRDSRDFSAVVCALQHAVEAVIPAGRIYLLDSSSGRPVIGSLISGIGVVAEGSSGALVVRVEGPGRLVTIERFMP
jgi:hypothetical protein